MKQSYVEVFQGASLFEVKSDMNKWFTNNITIHVASTNTTINPASGMWYSMVVYKI